MTLLQFTNYLRSTGQHGMVYLDTLKNEPIIEFGSCIFPNLTEHCEGKERHNVTINTVSFSNGFTIYRISLSKRKPLLQRLFTYLTNPQYGSNSNAPTRQVPNH